MGKVKIRLLHLMKSFDIGGVEKSTLEYSNAITEQIDYVGIFAKYGFYDKSDILNSKVNRFFPYKKVSSIKYFFVNLYRLLKIISENKITHIHYHQRIFVPYIFFIMIFNRKVKVYYTHHNIFNDFLNHSIIAHKIIALNKYVEEDLPYRKHKKTIIIPHGIKEIYLKNNNEKIRFGFVGRLENSKNIIELLKEFKSVIESFPNAILNIYGDGSLKEKIKNFIINNNLEKNIIANKTTSNISEIYNNFEVLILPSQNMEAFPMVILEAFSFGIPVIVHNLAIYKNLVIDNYNGLIIEDNIRKKIIEMINKENEYSRFSENAIKMAKNYKFSEILKKYLDVYNNTLYF